MANPQAEDGHVDIANEIMEALSRINIPGEAMRVLLVIIRKTYGWHKKEDCISLSQFQIATGLKRTNVCRSIKRLMEMNIIYKGSSQLATGSSGSATSCIQAYGFQKDFDLWRVVAKQLPSSQSATKGSSQVDKRVVAGSLHTKETIQKKTNKRKSCNLTCDEDFWKEVRKIYTWIDLDFQINKMKGYQLTPRGKKWKLTRRSVIAWLNRIDKPLNLDAVEKDYPKFSSDPGKDYER